MRRALALLVGTCLLAVTAPAQQAGHIGLPVDWSFRHIVSHDAVSGAQKDPRGLYNALRYVRGRQQQDSATLRGRFPGLKFHFKLRPPKVHGDWHFPLGNGTMNSNNGAASSDGSPAKFSFDINAAPDCTNDYVVYALNVAGSATQPNLVAFNNLYSGASGSQQNITKASESGTTATITTQAAHGFTIGQSVIVDGVPINGYNGTFIITAVSATTFSYTTSSGLGNLANAGGTATLASAITSATESGSTVTVATSLPHGLTTGNYVTVQGVSVSGYNGVYTIASTPTTTTFTYTAATTGLAAGSGGAAAGSGMCGLKPTVKFAYNINTNNDLLTASPVISLDGTKVAFIGSTGGGGGASYFYVLTLPTTGSSGSWDGASNQYAAVTPGASDNAVLVSYKYASNQNSFGSSPYVDYSSDASYFGDDKGNIYKTTCTFTCAGSPANAAGYPVNFSTKQLSSPVVDLNTGMLFVGSVDGKLYSCNVSSCSTTGNSLAIGNGAGNGGIVDGPILDNTFGTLVVTSGQDAASGKVFTIAQVDESLNSLATVSGGNQAFPVPNGAISDEYYNNAVGNTTVTGVGFFCGPAGGGQADIFSVPFTQPSRTITSATETGTTVTITTSTNHGFTAGDTVVVAGVANTSYNGTFTILATPTPTTFTYTLATAGLASSSGGTAVQQQLTATNPPVLGTALLTAIAGPNKATCSPFTILTNGSERLFFSQPKAPCPSGSATDGCAFAYTFNTTTGVATQAATSDQHSGTSGMVVDNISTSPQASSLYFATQGKTAPNATSAPSCTYGTSGAAGYCAVKLTQSALQ